MRRSARSTAITATARCAPTATWVRHRPYWPNSKGAWIDHDPSLAEPPLEWSGAAAHWDHRVDEDHYEQPGNLFRKMTLVQRQALFENTARAMGDARLEAKQRHIANCLKADPAYGAGVAQALGLTPMEVAAE